MLVGEIILRRSPRPSLTCIKQPGADVQILSREHCHGSSLLSA
jgi:hypothetical protein